MNFKSPLSLYVIWHPNFTDGEKYAQSIYDTYNGNNNNSTHSNYNIPVYYRSTSYGQEIFNKIPYVEAQKNALIILVDEFMFNDANWRVGVDELLKKIPTNTRVFPVSFSRYALDFNKKYLTALQFIKTEQESPSIGNNFKKNNQILKYRLLVGISKFIFNLKEDYDTSQHSDPPIKLFISHAKKDGEGLAKSFKNYVDSKTKLKTFFDTNDIADGHYFEKEIKNHIDSSAFIIFNTDEYSSRDWCRREVIIAKRYRCPIISVLNIKIGEKRSFPYSGNFPTLIWKDNFKEVINLILEQVVSDKYNELYLKTMVTLYQLEKSHSCITLPKAPELFNYIDIENFRRENKKTKPLLVLYPDPPIGIEELTLLNDIDREIKFVTPLMLPTYFSKND